MLVSHLPTPPWQTFLVEVRKSGFRQISIERMCVSGLWTTLGGYTRLLTATLSRKALGDSYLGYFYHLPLPLLFIGRSHVLKK